MAQRGVPEPTELIFTPAPSWLPVFAAAGIALAVLGLFAGWIYGAVGAIIALWSLLRWIREARQSLSRLPVRQCPATAVLPATTLRRAGERREGLQS